MNNADVERIVALQVKAAHLQADIKRHLIPSETFFPRMLGWIAQTQGLERAQHIDTLFEIGAQDHAELVDGMMQRPKQLTKAIQEVAARPRKRKRG